MKEQIIVTMPAFNESKSIVNVIAGIKKHLKGTNFKVLVVDDGSIDDTAQVAKKAGAVVIIHPAKMGVAESFRTEMKYCVDNNADIIVHLDSDGQHLPSDIPRLLGKVKDGYDLVVGSRFLANKKIHMPFVKKWGNRAFSKVLTKVTGVRISDGQSGFRAFTRAVAKKVDITSEHTYTQEQLIRAAKLKFRIAEVPINVVKRKHGKSRLIKSPLSYAIKAWIDILRIHRDFDPVKFFGKIGLFFFSLGFIVGLYVVYLVITTHSARIPSTILAVLLMVVGVQVILFGFLADMLRK